jgi:hypothetical protein
MNRYVRVLIAFAILAALLIIPNVAPANAASNVFVSFVPTGSAPCTNTRFVIPIIGTMHISEATNNTMAVYINGVLDNTISFNIPTPTNYDDVYGGYGQDGFSFSALPYNVTIRQLIYSAATHQLLVTIIMNGHCDAGGTGTATFQIIYPSQDSCANFSDGRLNKCDAGQTAAVYCKADGSVEVLAIYKGEGYPAFTATTEEIAKVPTHPAKNTLIKSGNGAFLYRLTSGLLQVNRAEDGTGKVYSFRFGCG